MGDEQENTTRLLPQFRYALGNSSFLKSEESSERFGYTTHSVQGALLYPYGNPVSGFLSAGGRFAHADETSLGSRRFLADLEGGIRLFIPKSYLELFALEAGVTAGAGQSSLNFGGGNIPSSAFDSHVGLLGRVVFQYRGFDLGAGGLYGTSLSRNYGEWGWAASLSVPLGNVDVTKTPNEEENENNKKDTACEELAKVENKVAGELEPASGIFTGAKELYDQIRYRQQDNERSYNLQLERNEYLKKNNFKCPEIPDAKESQPEYPDSLPPRPTWTSCAEGLPLIQKYLATLREARNNLGTQKTKLDNKLGAARIRHSRIDAWDKECIASNPGGADTLKLVTTDKGTYRLLTDLLFPNANPDLALVEQKNLGNNAGYTEPYLDEWIRFLRQNPKYKVKIEGYASDVYSPNAKWDEADMIALAQKRADNVAWYFQNRGKAGTSYTFKGGKKLSIDGPFVAVEVTNPISKDQIYDKPQGKSKADLVALAKVRYGEDTDEKLLSKTLSDPTFRMVRITILRKNADGQWTVVNLKGEENQHVK